jgi:hypothetical protein
LSHVFQQKNRSNLHGRMLSKAAMQPNLCPLFHILRILPS